MGRGRTPREREEEDRIDWGYEYEARREAHAEHEMDLRQDAYERYIFGDDL